MLQETKCYKCGALLSMWKGHKCPMEPKFMIIEGPTNDIVWHEDGSVTRTITDPATGKKTVSEGGK